MAPQIMTRWFSIVCVLNKVAGIWIPITRIRRSPDVTNLVLADHDVGQIVVVGDSVGSILYYSKDNYKNILKFREKYQTSI